MDDIQILSEEIFCFSEPDYKIHKNILKLNCSAAEDNHSDLNLVKEICSKFDRKINCLDLGCAGGALILDLNEYKATDICIGLDGSDGVYKHNSWNIEKNKKVLRHTNLIKDFSVLNKSSLVKFEVISCFEVIEHFDISQLDVFFKNVNKHLSEDGFFFGSIALFPDIRDSNGFHQKHPSYNKSLEQYILHKTVLDSKEEWNKILKNYFVVSEYDFSIKLRNHSNSYYFKCLKKK
jgi:cyclopropane fatty-acyl-phospholipid synthase-like methyltransferase